MAHHRAEAWKPYPFILVFSLLLCLPNLLISAPDEVHNPVRIIKGQASGLNRPEGIDFSPDGDFFAVANANGNSIAVYTTKGMLDANCSITPSCLIEDPVLLKYAHDVKFSPCGQFLAVASREANTIVFYKRDEAHKCSFHREPYSKIVGPNSMLKNPASLAFSPCGRFLAVCNRSAGGGLTFYKRVNDDNGRYESAPFFCLTEDKLLEHKVSAPHGIAFCPDGKRFAVVHKKYFKNKHARGESALVVYHSPEADNEPFCPTPASINYFGDICLHSVTIHPTEPLLMTVAELNGASFYHLDSERGACLPIGAIGAEGRAPIKGGAFTPDGIYFALTTEDSSILIYQFPEIGP